MNLVLIPKCGRGTPSRLVGCIAVLLCFATVSHAKEPLPPLAPPQAAVLGAVDFKQRLNHQVPVESTFTNDRGERVTLAECIDGRPTLFVLAYYRCPMLCNQVLNGVARVVQGIDFEPGEDIEIVVVSFDPTDTVELAAAKKKGVVHAFDHNADGTGWHFLIGDEQTVAAAADSVGFEFQYDDATNQFAHASGIVVLTPEGRVSRYFFGIDYPTRDVRLGLVEASEGNIGSPVDALLLYCFHYDPLTGRYGLEIMRVIRAGGLATVAAIICFVGVSLHRERKQRRALAPLSAGERSGEGLGTADSRIPPLTPPFEGGGS